MREADGVSLMYHEPSALKKTYHEPEPDFSRRNQVPTIEDDFDGFDDDAAAPPAAAAKASSSLETSSQPQSSAAAAARGRMRAKGFMGGGF